jgi:tetratricopeptide (TPR) repeat protein/tRNA A-37 threonylcarbamoyl transferase component Bud32
LVVDPTERLRAALADRYRVEREVGAGGMATVYLAEDLKHRRKVAVKVLRPELAATLGPERFVREIEIAAQLQHPHILPLLDSGDAEGFLYYVMPWVEGEPRRARLARSGELPVPEAARILCEVADAIAYAHERGVVHRDIKPDNVMLSGRHALVTDFGVAKAVSEATGRQQLTTAGVALGTPAYMAPEQAAADPHIDHRADIYALGAMGYELFTGRPPFVGNSPQQVLAMHVTEPAQPVTQFRPTLPPVLGDAIMRCLAKRPADRWQTAGELLGRIEGAVTPTGGTTPTSTQPVDAVALRALDWKGHPIRVGGLFLLGAVAVLGVVYFLTIQLGLPNWVPWVALGLLAAGLPIMILTGLLERRRARARATGMFTSGGEAPVQRAFTWRRAMLGGVGAFALLGVGTIVYTAMRMLGIGPVGTLVAAGKLNSRDRVLVAEFVNRAPDTTLGVSVTEAFQIDLAQTQVIRVMNSREIAAGLQRMGRNSDAALDPATANELAIREGAKAVVLGEINQVGGSYVLTARLISPVDGTELVALRENAEDDKGILAAIDRLSGRMRERIGESLKTIRGSESLDQVTTASLDALRLYSQGVRAADQGDFERAQALLRQAIAIDTGFAMAWRKLAVTLSNSGASNSRVIDATTHAYANRERLPDVERYQATAYYYNAVDVDPDQEAAAYRSLLSITPNNTTALNNLSIILNNRREYAEAERLIDQGLQTDSTVSSMYVNGVSARLGQGKVAEARQLLSRMERVLGGTNIVTWLSGLVAASQGQYDSATIRFDSLAAARQVSWQEVGLLLSYNADLTRGRVALARRHLDGQLRILESDSQPGTYLGNVAAFAAIRAQVLGDPAGGRAMVDSALARYPLSTIPVTDRPYSTLAAALARSGDPGRARRLIAEYETTVPEGLRKGDAFRHTAAGDIAMQEGRWNDAIQSYRKWRDESGCSNCGWFDIGQAFEKAGQQDSALLAYRRGIETPGNLQRNLGDPFDLARTYKRLGELEESRDRARALEYYGQFVELWKDADPALQPTVRDIRARMAQLANERD